MFNLTRCLGLKDVDPGAGDVLKEHAEVRG